MCHLSQHEISCLKVGLMKTRHQMVLEPVSIFGATFMMPMSCWHLPDATIMDIYSRCNMTLVTYMEISYRLSVLGWSLQASISNRSMIINYIFERFLGYESTKAKGLSYISDAESQQSCNSRQAFWTEFVNTGRPLTDYLQKLLCNRMSTSVNIS